MKKCKPVFKNKNNSKIKSKIIIALINKYNKKIITNLQKKRKIMIVNKKAVIINNNVNNK